MTRAVDSRNTAYNDFDGERFAVSLDSVIVRPDRLYARNCQ